MEKVKTNDWSQLPHYPIGSIENQIGAIEDFVAFSSVYFLAIGSPLGTTYETGADATSMASSLQTRFFLQIPRIILDSYLEQEKEPIPTLSAVTEFLLFYPKLNKTYRELSAEQVSLIH
ncbi:hypothetical protein LguiB_006504 [Lonicera macranthoides]